MELIIQDLKNLMEGGITAMRVGIEERIKKEEEEKNKNKRD